MGQLNTGSIIAELRREAGYTQKSLATVLGVTCQAVSKWERGLCLPDKAIIPKLSVLLDTDIENLLNHNNGPRTGKWAGFLDFQDNDVDLSRNLYDKPAIFYVLSHYLLLGISDIFIRTSDSNIEYLMSPLYCKLGFNFIFNLNEIDEFNLMIMNEPCFLFGSDLTRQFLGAMQSGVPTKMIPMKGMIPFLFCPRDSVKEYMLDQNLLYDNAVGKTLGRGMLCIGMDSEQTNADISAFVEIYQKNTCLLIGSLEEIAYMRGIIEERELRMITMDKPYGNIVLDYLKISEKRVSKPEVD